MKNKMRLIIINLKRKKHPFMRNFYYFDWLDFIFNTVIVLGIIAFLSLVVYALRAPNERATYAKLDKDHELVCVIKRGWGITAQPYYEKCVNWVEVTK